VARRTFLSALAIACLAVLGVSPAQGGRSNSDACGAKPFSYAGVQSGRRAFGVSANLVPLATPSVSDGHVGGWIGVGGPNAGPGGVAQWLQVGLSAFASDGSSRIYYEVTVAGSRPSYVELAGRVAPGEGHHFAVLEMSKRRSWWRVWVDHRPVSAPIHLPGSHGVWYPQAVAETWNGGTGACNAFAYRFSNVRLAHATGGVWQPLRARHLFQDAGYRVVQTSLLPSSFLAARSS
jgi:hypothetical protein